MQRQRIVRSFALIAVIILIFSALCDIAFAQYATIPYGSKGDNVRKMQDALRRKGFYKGRVDGEFGPETRRAVIRFQASLGITADGKPGNKTLTALYNGGSSAINQVNGLKAKSVTATNPHSLYYGCTGSRVSALQRALRATGHYKGVIDGVYGDLTELAVRRFQTSKGMHVDGIVGKETLARLNNAQKAVKISANFLLTTGSRGAEVSSAQRKLVSLSFLSPGYTNGVYDAATKDAVILWQKATKRAETGTLTESQYNALILQK